MIFKIWGVEEVDAHCRHEIALPGSYELILIELTDMLELI